MFNIDPSLSFLDLDGAQVSLLFESINQPHVAVPHREAQSALGYIVGLRDSKGAPALHIYLWLSRSREAVIYTFEDRQLLQEDAGAGRDRAVEFCESMGFMMEELPLPGSDDAARAQLLESLAPFQREPALRSLEGNPSLAKAPSGPSMNANYEAGLTPGVLEPIEVLEPIDEDEPATLSPSQVEKLARLFASF